MGLTQEMWALLTVYQALRSMMVTAVETVPGCDPDRAGFTVALEAARDTVVGVAGTAAAATPSGRPDLVGHIGTHVLKALLPKRRMRLSARIVKCGTSRYNIWNRDGRPRDSTPITAIVITVHPPVLPATHAPDRAASGRWGQVCRILAENSNQAMHARDIAGHLGLIATERMLSGFNAQLCYWARNGRRIRTAPSTYKLPHPEALTLSTEPELRGIGRASPGGRTPPAARRGPPARAGPASHPGPHPTRRPTCPRGNPGACTDGPRRSRTGERDSHTPEAPSWTPSAPARTTAAPGASCCSIWIRHPRAVQEAPSHARPTRRSPDRADTLELTPTTGDTAAATLMIGLPARAQQTSTMSIMLSQGVFERLSSVWYAVLPNL